jgi:hypothetical protein
MGHGSHFKIKIFCKGLPLWSKKTKKMFVQVITIHNRHHIVRQNFMENPKIIIVFHPENFHSGPKWFLK